MANDLFGGLFKGLSSFMPKDDPNVQLLSTQNDVNELETREQELYARIGRKLYPSIEREPQFAEIAVEVRDVERQLAMSREKLARLQREKNEKEREEQERKDALTCGNCGAVNPEGMKFCQECGNKLGSGKLACPNCGVQQPQGTRFCGECGGRI